MTEISINWNIAAPSETPGINANRFDQPTQGDTPFGPEPDAPSSGPPETEGR